MELQLFDGSGDYCLRVNAGEPLWLVLRDGLRNVGIVPVDDPLERDVSIEGHELTALLESVGGVLRDRLARILPTDTAGHYDESMITVFGEPISIRIRNPGHYEVKRINSLYVCLARIIESKRRAQLLAVPDLNTIDHGIIGVLENSPAGLDVSHLGAMLNDRFTELQSATSDPDVRASLGRQVESLDDATIAEHVERLAYWDLVDHAPDGTVSASEKLRRILH